MDQDHNAEFEAEVQIGKGMRFIDRRGSASIDHGRLRLCLRNGALIAQAPLSQVWAEKARFSGGVATRVSIEATTYTVEPVRVWRCAPRRPSPDASATVLDLTRLGPGRALTRRFLGVLASEGGHVGKPAKTPH
jgi:hypothetical protein